MHKSSNQIGSRVDQRHGLHKVKTPNAVFLIYFLVFLFSLSSINDCQADPPKKDPWYYVHDQAYKFIVPDKFQHFYGSAMLTEIIGPMPALAVGFIKEVHDDSEANVGFSMKDIAADALGVMSAKFARNESVKLWLDWDPSEETLVVNFGIRI